MRKSFIVGLVLLSTSCFADAIGHIPLVKMTEVKIAVAQARKADVAARHWQNVLTLAQRH